MILLVAACHVFQALEIPCVAGEPCAGGGGTVVDDTGPRAPVTGWIVAYDTPGQTVVVETHAPDGGVIDTWTVAGAWAGPVAWSVDRTEGALVDGGRVYTLAPEAAPRVVGEVPNGQAAAEIAVLGGYLWFAVGDGVYASDLDAWFTVFDGDLSRAEHLAASADTVWVSAETEEGVDVFGVDPAALTWRPGWENLNGPRARNLFVGPDEAPFACSAAGAVYALDALADGSAAPVAFYNGTLTDVRDCGYDPGDGRYLLFSPSGGVWKVDERGNGELLAPIPEDHVGVRANFFR